MLKSCLYIGTFVCFVHFVFGSAQGSCSEECGPDEVPWDCDNDDSGIWYCDQTETSSPLLEDGTCFEGCRCKDGLLRTENGDCVPEKQCPKKCGDNERPTSCFEALCERRNCSDLNKSIICVRIDPRNCTSGCLCEEGYLRDISGKCIPVEQCPDDKCRDNEVYDICPSLCPGERCGVDPSTVLCLPSPQPGDPGCKPGCRCQDGYLRDQYGYCIPKEQCPVCEENEVYDTCIASCPPRRCDIDESVIKCARPLEPGDPKCEAGCRCADNFYRNYKNVCVPKNECEKCEGPNENFKCGGACDNVCTTLSKQNQTHCPFVKKKCNQKCYCNKGYARNDCGICVPINECPPPACGENEIYDVCPATCPPKTCDALGRAYKCKAPPKPGDPECKPSCRCADGYYRNKKGDCVLEKECPKPVICGKDEVYSNCVNGGCGRWNCSQSGTICIDLVEGACEEGCHCKEGLLRADNGTCIPADQCPANCYGKNEVSGCNWTCPPQTCESIGKKYFCPRQPSDCKPECRCKTGFYRNKIGECISKEDCLKCTGPNEYFSCGGYCDNVCATLQKENQTICPIQTFVCTPKCYCEEGYARDSYNVCVPISKCPQSCGINEVYDTCIASCPPRRCDVDETLIDCAPPLKPGDPKCEAGCRCADNFYRNNEGVCVPKNECPKCNGKNEIDGCRSDCPPQTCESIGKEYSCPITAAVCIPDCRCKPGFFRNKNNECISKEDCFPKCGVNEVFDDCPPSCPPQTCDFDPRVALCAPNPQPGDSECKPGCRCADNYLRNKEGQCIPKKKCPKPVICGKDEIYSKCANGGCRRWKCSQPGILCIDLIEGGCKEGCLCKEGLLRADNGTCVPADQCPLDCFGENEVSGCQSTCPPQTCESIGKIYHCPLQPTTTTICKHECRCKPGFFRNKIGQCISKENCLKCTKPNEYFSCGGPCDNVCATLQEQNQTNCPMVNIQCNSICYCEEGYARDSNKTCVPINECPKLPKCEINEVYDVCPPTCPPQRCDVDPRVIRCAANPKPGDSRCKPGCRCAENYLRNKEGRCIPKDKCPLKCGQNEESGCQVSCPPETCESIGKVYDCPMQYSEICKLTCRCKPGFYRNKVGQCISEENCSPQCDVNEVYDVCPPQYPPQRCEVDPNTIQSTYTENPKPGDSSCKPGCRCVDNYFRNEHEKCVPKDQCNSSSCQNNDLNLKKFEQGNIAFTEKFLYESAISNPGVSIIASPFSVLFLLLQLALYSTGLAKEQLSSLLKLDTKPDIRCFVPNYLDTLNSQQNVTFSLVEKVYGNDQYPFTAEFDKDTKDIFKAESENLDFCKSQQAADTINNDVAKETNNLIKDLVSPDMLNCDTVVVLTNAIYFKGIWKKKFEKKNTKKENFYVNNKKTVKVDMMKQTESFKYTELSDPPAQVLEIPYESDNFSFMIWLPKSKDGINDMLDKLKDKKFTLSGAIDGLRSRKVDLSLPTINVSTKTDMKDILMKNNQTAIFNRSRSGLTGIIKSSQPIYVSCAVQKATLILNEEGSKAAAATAIGIRLTSVALPMDKIVFKADHQFIYCILYTRTPIFCGIYAGP